ncbi:SDR family oxidoreductase [Sphingomonas sp. CGMCC 1.13654]|uniref:SDR family oxidoreductase n=1 Tax=Sphingomonas chungangi TaxID=2683589 RepID=A0A838L560_9SPHN|nr:SDR family oxidoreductase [Sphingomonas chungangi]MBA2934167.1 SDR family oxidoreductase [Sphingomonas chungangi]MVW57208.1 SDR family oxidoreductase [Sphingomonas chungangi]
MIRPLALVTGGCRRLGAAICLALGEAGYDLAIHSSPSSAPEAALRERLAAMGAAWHHLTADLADEAAVEGLLPAVEQAAGRMPALLVNNAARFEYDSPDTVTQGGLLDHYAVNCAAPVLLARALAATAPAGRPAAIVNILDQRIAAPNADQFSYTLSKLALSEATTILARQFAPHVRVSAVAPGLTLPTPDYDEARMNAAAEQMPLHLLPGPAEIAEAVVFLARARAITGQTLFVDGGAHLRHYPRDFLFLDGDAEA